MQLALFRQQDSTTNLKEDLFQAYFDARKNKRNTINALAFEKHFESNIFQLHHDIVSGTYEPKQSICFIVNQPVKREIFAANFRDRVVHHYLINKLNPLFEKQFIYDSYACRVGKGTHLGVQRINRFIRKCSRNYTQDCYILKLDIQGFFMHINKNMLLNKLDAFINVKYNANDKVIIKNLCKLIVHNDPTKKCIIKGNKRNWQGLPPDKSLFSSPKNCGLPIGNLTSQVFANFYMNEFDHFVKKELGINYYGRYVDDFILVHQDKEYLKSLISRIREFLKQELHLTLHPKKIYLQHFKKGVKFLGAVIKPNRIYIANRTKGNFYKAIEQQNKIVRKGKPTKEELLQFISSMNSYLGIMQHYKTYKLRKKHLFNYLSGWWWNYVYLSGGLSRFVLKTKPIAPHQSLLQGTLMNLSKCKK